MATKKRRFYTKSNNFKYKKLKTHYCIYCGELAEVWDHVPPLSLACGHDGCFLKVCSCKNCNSLLTDLDVCKLNDRKKHLIKRITKKYTKKINIPHWGEKEIKQLRGCLNGTPSIELKLR